MKKVIYYIHYAFVKLDNIWKDAIVSFESCWLRFRSKSMGVVYLHLVILDLTITCFHDSEIWISFHCHSGVWGRFYIYAEYEREVYEYNGHVIFSEISFPIIQAIRDIDEHNEMLDSF